MIKRANIYQRFNLLILFVVAITLLMTSTIMIFTTRRIADTVSKHYARMYSSEIVTAVEAHVSREIGLSIKMANTLSLLNWMQNESDAKLKALAFEELKAFNEVFHDNNLFVAVGKSKNMYFTDLSTTPETFNKSGTLSENVPDDIWYFKTIASSSNYSLNIDEDRFLGTIRVWINVKVVNEGKVIGCVGTGLFLNPFIDEIFIIRDDDAAKTVIINQLGAIQLDSDLSKIEQNSFEETRSDSKSVYEYTNDETFNNAVKAYLLNPDKQVVFKIKNSDYDYAAISMIHDTQWHVVTFYSRSGLYTPFNLLSVFFSTIFVTVVMAAVINLIVNRTFVKPLRALTESVGRKEVYREETIFGTHRNDEFGILANSIEQMSERLVKSIPVGMFLLDSQMNLIYANEYFINQFACKDKISIQERFRTNPQSLFASIETYPRLSDLISKQETLLVYETQFIDFNGNQFWAEIHMHLKVFEDDSMIYEGILINTQGKKDYEQKLLDLASTDALTGLYNRHKFNELVVEEISRSERYGGPLSLIIFDLDHFKSINDSYGHIIGDEVLVEATKIASSSLRSTDVIARWGGEEFSILLPGTNSSGARYVAEKIRIKLEEHHHNIVEKVTGSFGVTQVLPNETYLDWFNRVDQALFKAKSQGRNQVVVSEEDYSERVNFFKIVWQDSFNSGNDQIDAQHKKLFELSNALLELEFTQHTIDQTMALYHALKNHFVDHTITEEALLKRLGYPEDELQKHHESHQILIEKLIAMKDTIETSPTDVFMLLIQDIILDHMIKEDILYFDITKRNNRIKL